MHEYTCSLSLILKGTMCSFCSNRKLCSNDDCNFCYNKSFAKIDKSEFWSKKNILKARNVFKNNNNAFVFDCNFCAHEFIATLSSICQGNWCPFCSNKKLCFKNDCITCHEKSFSSSDKVDFWSDKNILKPRNVFKSSNFEFIFDCNICGHEFMSTLNHITNGSWCPFCSNKKLCLNNDCNFCHDKSFASSDKAEFWSEINFLKPRDVFKSSNLKFYFKCNYCAHNFSTTLNNITHGKSWCPYCSSNILCSNNDCILCFDKSFASCEKATFWSEKNLIKPREIFKYCNDTYIFNCNICNQEYTAIIENITKGNWCSCELRKTETKLYKWFIKKKYNINKQVKFIWCKNSKTDRCLPFDFVIEKYKLIIELDGLQHFNEIMNWQKPEKRQKTDVYKMKKALENGYSIIRLLQTDVWYNKNNWQDNLTKYIKYYETPICIFMDKNNEYSMHKKMMRVN